MQLGYFFVARLLVQHSRFTQVLRSIALPSQDNRAINCQGNWGECFPGYSVCTAAPRIGLRSRKINATAIPAPPITSARFLMDPS